jgi:hypothetical protein
MILDAIHNKLDEIDNALKQGAKIVFLNGTSNTSGRFFGQLCFEADNDFSIKESMIAYFQFTSVLYYREMEEHQMTFFYYKILIVDSLNPTNHYTLLIWYLAVNHSIILCCDSKSDTSNDSVGKGSSLALIAVAYL